MLTIFGLESLKAYFDLDLATGISKTQIFLDALRDLDQEKIRRIRA
jgi:hypothetical protein